MWVVQALRIMLVIYLVWLWNSILEPCLVFEDLPIPTFRSTPMVALCGISKYGRHENHIFLLTLYVPSTNNITGMSQVLQIRRIGFSPTGWTILAEKKTSTRANAYVLVPTTGSRLSRLWMVASWICGLRLILLRVGATLSARISHFIMLWLMLTRLEMHITYVVSPLYSAISNQPRRLVSHRTQIRIDGFGRSVFSSDILSHGALLCTR